MICKKCGAKFADNNRFCPYCGSKADAVNESESVADHNLPSEKSKKGKIIAVIVAVTVVLAGISGYFVYRSVTKPTMVDLTSVMAEPEFEGVDGSGTIKVDACVDKKEADKLIKSIDNEDRAKAVKKLLESVTYSADQTKKLSNGDKISFTAHYDASFAEKNKITISNMKKTITVQRLAEELSADDIHNSGILEKLGQDERITVYNGVVYKWLYCKSSKGNIIAAVYSIEEAGTQVWYIANTNYFTKTLNGVYLEDWEAFQSWKNSYDECVNTIKSQGFTIETIQ